MAESKSLVKEEQSNDSAMSDPQLTVLSPLLLQEEEQRNWTAEEEEEEQSQKDVRF